MCALRILLAAGRKWLPRPADARPLSLGSGATDIQPVPEAEVFGASVVDDAVVDTAADNRRHRCGIRYGHLAASGMASETWAARGLRVTYAVAVAGRTHTGTYRARKPDRADGRLIRLCRRRCVRDDGRWLLLTETAQNAVGAVQVQWSWMPRGADNLSATAQGLPENKTCT